MSVPIAGSPRSGSVTLLLLLLAGPFGAHRFYAGRTRSAIVQLLTFGGLGVWWLADAVLFLTDGFRDAEGRRIESPI